MFSFLLLVLSVSSLDIFEPVENNIPLLDDMRQAYRMGGYPLLNFLNIEWERLRPIRLGIHRAWIKLTRSKEQRLHLDQYLYTNDKTSMQIPTRKNSELTCDHGTKSQTTSGTEYCECDAGYAGQTCNLTCDNGVTTYSQDKTTSYCKCTSGYVGPSCDISCEHGYYYNGVCRCFTGYQGSDCSVECNHGTVDGSSCVCDEGYMGDSCNINCFSDYADLTQDDDGNYVCTCHDGYYGPNCSYSQCFLGEVNVCVRVACRSSFYSSYPSLLYLL